MNLKEHYQEAMAGDRPLKEVSLGSLSAGAGSMAQAGARGLAKAGGEIGSGIVKLFGGPEEFKKALATNAFHTLTGLEPSQIERAYDRLYGKTDSNASDLVPIYKKLGIRSAFPNVKDDQFEQSLKLGFEPLGSKQKQFAKAYPDAFVVLTFALAMQYPKAGGSLQDAPMDIHRYFQIEDLMHANHGSLMTRARVYGKYIEPTTNQLQNWVEGEVTKSGGVTDVLLSDSLDPQKLFMLVYNNNLLQFKSATPNALENPEISLGTSKTFLNLIFSFTTASPPTP